MKRRCGQKGFQLSLATLPQPTSTVNGGFALGEEGAVLAQYASLPTDLQDKLYEMGCTARINRLLVQVLRGQSCPRKYPTRWRHLGFGIGPSWVLEFQDVPIATVGRFNAEGWQWGLSQPGMPFPLQPAPSLDQAKAEADAFAQWWLYEKEQDRPYLDRGRANHDALTSAEIVACGDDGTAAEALARRNAILQALRTHADRITQGAAPLGLAARTRGLLKVLQALVPRADLVLWRSDVWGMAQARARETFHDCPIGDIGTSPRSEFWMPAGKWIFRTDQRDYKLLAVAMLSNADLKPLGEERIDPDGQSMEQTLIPVLLMHPDEPGHTVPLPNELPPLLATTLCDANLSLVAARHFMNLPIVEREGRQIDRRTRRKTERDYRCMPEVLEVTIRRRERQGGGGQRDVDWSCQWWVRGHWRKNHRDPARPIYVTDHLKGPDHKPLRLPRERVLHVRR
jgi:hypothetical protein